MKQIPDADILLLREASRALDAALRAPVECVDHHIEIARAKIGRVLADAEMNGAASTEPVKSVPV